MHFLKTIHRIVFVLKSWLTVELEKCIVTIAVQNDIGDG